VLSFHQYGDLESTAATVRDLRRDGRPLLCTEWMHRPAGSRIATHLPLFAREKVGAFQWGFVVGRTQTNLSWDTMGGTPDPHPALWQHDLLWPDGTPYDESEVRAIRAVLEGV
jgi:hypothetical protein